MANNTRPWQGTTLAVLAIINAVCAFLLAILLLAFQGVIVGFLSGAPEANAGGLMAIITAFMIPFALFIIGFGVLDIFMARGFLKGQRWEIILAMIFSGLGALGVLSSLFSRDQSFGNLLFSIAILAAYFYLLITCWKDPFYTKK